MSADAAGGVAAGTRVAPGGVAARRDSGEGETVERVGLGSEEAELPVLDEDFAAVAAAAERDLLRLSDSTVLVAGAEGLLGAGLVRALAWCRRYGLPAPARIVAVVEPGARGAPGALPLSVAGVEVVPLAADAPIPDGLDARFAVLAPPAAPVPGDGDPVEAMETLTGRTRRLLAWAARRRALAGVLLVSDAEVYGNLRAEEVPAGEDTRPGALAPSSAAGPAAARRYCEALALAAVRSRGLPVRIARAFHLYGPGLALDSGAVIADFLGDRVAGGPIRLRGEGDRVRSFCYLADALVGALAVLARGAAGEVFNLGNDRETITVVELARLVARLEPPRLRIVPAVGRTPARLAESPRRLVPDCSRAHRRLDFAATTPLPEGLRRTLRWLREAGLARASSPPAGVGAPGLPGFASMRRPCTSALRPLRPEAGVPGRSTPI